MFSCKAALAKSHVLQLESPGMESNLLEKFLFSDNINPSQETKLFATGQKEK